MVNRWLSVKLYIDFCNDFGDNIPNHANGQMDHTIKL